MESFIIVFTTCANAEEAENIGKVALDERLVACANIMSEVNSFFHWKGNIENETEVLMVMKTRSELLQPLIEMIQSYHSYDVPEIIALPIVGGSKAYLDWIREETDR